MFLEFLTLSRLLFGYVTLVTRYKTYYCYRISVSNDAFGSHVFPPPRNTRLSDERIAESFIRPCSDWKRNEVFFFYYDLKSSLHGDSVIWSDRVYERFINELFILKSFRRKSFFNTVYVVIEYDKNTIQPLSAGDSSANTCRVGFV